VCARTTHGWIGPTRLIARTTAISLVNDVGRRTPAGRIAVLVIIGPPRGARSKHRLAHSGLPRRLAATRLPIAFGGFPIYKEARPDVIACTCEGARLSDVSAGARLYGTIVRTGALLVCLVCGVAGRVAEA